MSSDKPFYVVLIRNALPIAYYFLNVLFNHFKPSLRRVVNQHNT